MFEPEFADKRKWRQEKKRTEKFTTALSVKDVEWARLLYWREHCLECAPPECYKSCGFYEARRDKRCVRARYGIYPDSSHKGYLGFGADVRFKKWAKLGTTLYPGRFSPKSLRKIQRMDLFTSKIVNAVFGATNFLNPFDRLKINRRNPQRQLFKAQTYFREKLLRKVICRAASSKIPFAENPDCLVIECYSFEELPFNLVIEYNGGSFLYRDSVKVSKGDNYFEIPAEKFYETVTGESSLIVYPENNLEARLIFTWLDFVKKRKSPLPSSKGQKRSDKEKPAAKIKCAAWDLDNTLWEGTLIDSSTRDMVIKEDCVKLIKQLDERGIIQTIVSKNDHDEAWAVLEKHGISEYFVYPAINWGQKSENLRACAKAININLDTFAFIDDSPFERAEVESALPQVRVYTEVQIPELLSLPEFDIEVTEESRKRRKSYLVQMQREKVAQEYWGDYKSFLKECKMELTLFCPKEEKHLLRCFELIERSNQLNLSSRRYSREQFRELNAAPGIFCAAIRCKDKFGDYGTVGFASVDERGEVPKIVDLVISCRVAKKMVEHTFIEWLSLREKVKGASQLEAAFVKTKKNGPLGKVFEELPFEVFDEDGENILYRLNLEKPFCAGGVIEVNDKTEK
ncbi:MAG: HAD-IIIC family phosphatase [Chitinispirillales bacterium]|jgi:FkbH-like protein|nr:HAD-IIIC family phosphatase [Chitinispirillales bacterium]